MEPVVASSPHPSHNSNAYSMDSSIPVYYTPSRDRLLYITAEMQPATNRTAHCNIKGGITVSPNSKGIRFKVGVTVRLPNNPGDIIAKGL